MNAGKLLKLLFPKDGDLRVYLLWRQERRAQYKRQQELRKQLEARRAELAAMSSDIDDDDYDELSDEVWQEVKRL